MPPLRAPPPATLFFGRQAELERVRSALGRVRAALIYGVAGVGKSTLAYALAGQWQAPVVYHRAAPGEPLSVVLDNARRQLAGGPVPDVTGDDDRIADLSERLDAAQGLLLIDDIHRLRPDEHPLLFHALMEQMRRGSLLATSRELVPLSPGSPDRLELRLEGLDESSARALWTSLDELYGPSAGFEQAWKRARGSPFLLRRAHAGGLDDEDPIASTVRALSEPERRIAGALALAEVPLPTATLCALVPADQGRQTLRALVTRMIVTVDGASTCALHDLFRDAMAGALAPAERQALHRALSELLPAAELDPVARVREICRHLLALGRHEDAGAVLLSHAPELIRQGATAELLAGLEAIPAERRTSELKILHARTLARLLEVRRAYEEMRLLVEAGVEPRIDLKLAFGNVALLSANLDAAESALADVFNTPDVPLAARMRAGVGLVLAQTYRGEGDAARASLDSVAPLVTDPLNRGFVLFCKAFSFFMEERYREAEEPMRLAMELFQGAAPTIRGALMAPAFFMSLLACLGELDEAERYRLAAEAALQRGQDLRMRTMLRAGKAVLLYARGERERGLQELQAVREIFSKGGEALWALWAKAWIGRWLIELGRLSEGEATLAETAEQMEAAGMIAGVRYIEASRGLAPPEAAGRAPSGDEASLDARTHLLKVEGKEISLARRPVLRRLLYALADRAGSVVPKADLATAVWAAEYNPLLHDNALRVNVRYLRSMLAGTPLAIQFDDVGYRLTVPEGFVYVGAPQRQS